ncbi:CRISPR-associated protein Cas2 [Paenochrobactrum sp. BZR 588]|uniref:CRISPR-associated protein Cas2 n=1 Tax=unclassified Paenochrobactrum TaxID=2639760 RepID=UPI00385360DA
MSYFIGYDLNKEGDNYTSKNKKLRDHIKEKYPTYWCHLDSTFIVVTDKTAKDIRDDLKQFLDDNDELLVAKLTGEGAWSGFNDNGSNWLKNHL